MYTPQRSRLAGLLLNKSHGPSKPWANATTDTINAVSVERNKKENKNKYFATIRNIALAKQTEHVTTKNEHETLEQQQEEHLRAEHEVQKANLYHNLAKLDH